MEATQVAELEQLRNQIQCSRNYQCIGASLDSLCAAKYHAISDMLQCLDDDPAACEFSKPFSASTHKCTCPLRKHIAIHIEKF
jgi:predicted HD phosphohydrolase